MKTPEQNIGGSQIEQEKELNLETKEIEMIKEALTNKIFIILQRFNERVQEFESSGKSLDEAIKRNIAGAQDGRIGDDEVFNLSLDNVNEAQVYSNLMFLMGQDKSVFSDIAARKAMEKDERLGKWINSIIKGAEKCDDKKMKEGKYTEANHQQGQALKNHILYEK